MCSTVQEQITTCGQNAIVKIGERTNIRPQKYFIWTCIWQYVQICEDSSETSLLALSIEPVHVIHHGKSVHLQMLVSLYIGKG